MIKWLRRMWRVRQRSTDLDILWPACKSKAPDLNMAKMAFAYHALHDTAWTDDMTRDEIYAFIEALS
jgi:hypothetical protein